MGCFIEGGLLEHRFAALESCPILRKNNVESSASQTMQWSKDVVKHKNQICGTQGM